MFRRIFRRLSLRWAIYCACLADREYLVRDFHDELDRSRRENDGLRDELRLRDKSIEYLLTQITMAQSFTEHWQHTFDAKSEMAKRFGQPPPSAGPMGF